MNAKYGIKIDDLLKIAVSSFCFFLFACIHIEKPDSIYPLRTVPIPIQMANPQDATTQNMFENPESLDLIIRKKQVDVIFEYEIREIEEPFLSQPLSIYDFPFIPKKIECKEAEALARSVSKEYGLDVGLIIGIMRTESAFIKNAISPKGAVGLMQVMPEVGNRSGCNDLFDPLENTKCGAKILSYFLGYYGNNLISALSAYNAGFMMPNNAKKEGRIPANFQYVEDVLRARMKWIRFGCDAWD